MSEQRDITTASEVEYPWVTVELLGKDGNAFNIIGSVQHAIRHAVGPDQAEAWISRAYELPSYDALLALVQATVVVI